MGRSTQGVTGVKLDKDDEVVGDGRREARAPSSSP